MTSSRKKGHEHQCSRAVVLTAGKASCCPGGREPQGPLMVAHRTPGWATFTGCQKFLVLLGWVGWGELQNSPPYPLGSTRHSGSNCTSLGSSAGCTGSGLLRCCCGHTDSPHVGGKGRRCGASSGGSGDAPYCSGPLP